MKCLLVIDSEKDEALYSEYESGIIGPQIKSIINFIKYNIGEKPFFLQAGKHKFVFQYTEHIWFILVSDDDDSELLLRKRLHLLNTLFIMILGDVLILKKASSFNSMYQLKKKMSQISATVNSMFDESQSVMVQAYESLEVNDGLRKKCNKQLNEILNSLPNANGALLFVGTKLLEAKYKSKQLNHFDIFLLSIYIQIQLHPRTIEKVQRPNTLDQNEEMMGMEEEMSSSSSNNNINNLEQQSNISMEFSEIEEDVYHTASEDFDEKEPLSFLSSKYLDQFLGINSTILTPNESNNNNNSFGESAQKRSKHQMIMESLKNGLTINCTGNAVALINYCLYWTGKLYPDEYHQSRDVYSHNTESAVKKFQEDFHLPITGNADCTTIKQILLSFKNSAPLKSKRNSSGSFIDISLGDDKSKPPSLSSTVSSNSSSLGGGVKGGVGKGMANSLNLNGLQIGGGGKEQQGEYTCAPSTFQRISLRMGNNQSSVMAFCAEVSKNIFLVILNKDNDKSQLDLPLLENSKKNINENICKIYHNFLILKESMNSVISISHIPGLVHFLLIDRANHRLRAPTISPLFGRDVHSNQANHQEMINFLKKKIWTMYSYTSQQLYRGYNYMIWNDNEFQYSYRLWVADDEDNEHKIEQPLTHNLRQTRHNPKSFYSELLKKNFPNSNKMKCYELLVVYVGILPVSMVAKNDKALNSLLFEKEDE
ncbi:hypothetical protein DLAC_06619 [Tieghemostelium lacteum]|uniref:Peptidoglycan binding-like domain-containing protein n=1 Tax=Tieghemostelium lacteum TaxID=361077 RepID=A0A151ZF80_TIELA|nr:hypothetical protein DLAC_06619 [Tieghemostelium lacteum]|eukprot:KYQ92623.1 hypothetical protein DLAC_06619 [Tieghemostelium lacteum]